eukprot:XP_008766468.1 PREDICTED: transmembrane protein 92-like [Rattus norvegicus]
MQDSWVLGTLTLNFSLLSSLQGVSGNKVSREAGTLWFDFICISPFLFVLTRHCPKGFKCCDNECCQESKIWDPDAEHFTIELIVSWIIFALLCICGLVMSKCKGLQHDLRPADHQTPPDPPSKDPLQSIWVTSLDPLPTIRCSEFNWD